METCGLQGAELASDRDEGDNDDDGGGHKSTMSRPFGGMTPQEAGRLYACGKMAAGLTISRGGRKRGQQRRQESGRGNEQEDESEDTGEGSFGGGRSRGGGGRRGVGAKMSRQEAGRLYGYLLRCTSVSEVLITLSTVVARRGLASSASLSASPCCVIPSLTQS
jgi:hypothetical protein